MRSNSHKITDTVFPDPFWVWHNCHCTWISVPKNANMQLRKICTACNMSRVKFQNTDSTETVCILRNPKTRLISALGEFKKRKRRKETINELMEILLADPRSFDEHLEPQSFYVHGVKFTHILKFEQLDQELHRVEWFAKHPEPLKNYINPARLQKSRHHGTPPDQLASEHSKLVDDIVNKYYAYDLELWQNHTAYQQKQL